MTKSKPDDLASSPDQGARPAASRDGRTLRERVMPAAAGAARLVSRLRR